MDMVSLIINHHDVLQPCQIFQFRASQIAAVQHSQVVAGSLARTNRQQLLYYLRYT